MQIHHLITVIIPTYNRSRELSRQLHFLSSFKQHYRILILDGGSEESRRENEMTCSMYGNVEHHEFDPNLHLGLRLHLGLQLVKTPYVLICGDDDLFFPQGVTECIDFLELNPDYSASIGQVWTLRYFPNKPLIAQGIMLGTDLNTGGSIDHERFISRTMFYFAYNAIGSIPLFYAVRRTDQTLKAFALMTPNIKYSSMELLTNCMLLIDGKVEILKSAFGLRDYSSITSRDPEREGADLYIPIEDIAYIKPLLINALTKKEGTDHAVVEYLIDTLLMLWANKPTITAAPAASEPRWRRRLRAINFYLRCLAGRYLPTIMAKLNGLDHVTFRALLKSHQQFTARRK
jgi:glycosyltransferase domain-containing protein